ncbi:unnamed protein product, partial [Iphiclides podalirius]
MSVLHQALYAVVVCYACVGMSLVIAWPSSTLRLFSSTNTTLHRPMSETETALFGSLSSIGALLATPLSGFLLDAIGRKNSCMLFSLPHLISWVIVVLNSRVEAILAARFVSGLGGCQLLVVSVYVSEFCQESIRGMMTSGAIIAYGLGMLVSYLLGGCLEYDTKNYVYLTMTAFGILILLPLKESPMFLMKKGREKTLYGLRVDVPRGILHRAVCWWYPPGEENLNFAQTLWGRNGERASGTLKDQTKRDSIAAT